MRNIEQVLNIEKAEHILMLFGNYDKNIRILEEQFNVKIICRGTEVKISGEADSVEKANRAINALLEMIRRGDSLSED